MNANIIQAQDFKRAELKDNQQIKKTVAEILKDIRNNGDTAVNQWSQKIDGQTGRLIALSPFAKYDLAPELALAIKTAYQRIKTFCEFQIKDLKNDSFNDDFGEFGYKYQAIERIGAYIPGGRFPLISTSLMTITPAQVAGCADIIACSPSNHPALLAAASLAGATQFLQLGGAQAIGALSYGYNDIDAVHMIVGPGNAYVNLAKAQVQHRTKIDTLAGPSELLIYSNALENPAWIVLDALAQGEHDPNAISLVVSTSQQLLENLYTRTNASAAGQQMLANKQILFIQAENQAQAVALINAYAPEHLLVTDGNCDLSLFSNYGSLFIGENSAVAFGDYCAGPNHTLPTNGAGKNSGGLSVHQFLKVLSTQKVNAKGRIELAKTAAILAQAEGLNFHQKSAEVRI
ncbi:MAG TPA: histidinol dehydrogenase [Oceanospirillales bacterium]|nr:histidinol dehydrogenase [Oceanospirillales bacterium]